MTDFDPELLTVQANALAELRSLPAASEKLPPPARRLRALIIEIIERFARHDSPFRLPGLGTLLEDTVEMAKVLGYPKPPLEVTVDENPNARRGISHPEDGEPFMWQSLHKYEPGLAYGGVTITAAHFWIDGRSVYVREPLGHRADYLETIFGLLFRWIRHLDLPPRPSGAVKTDGLGALEALERVTPPINLKDGTWLRSAKAAEHEGLETISLNTYRRDGEKSADGRFGRDVHGRIWRRPGTENAHPWYLVSSLRNQENTAKNHG